jgi:hypothetical protein
LPWFGPVWVPRALYIVWIENQMSGSGGEDNAR